MCVAIKNNKQPTWTEQSQHILVLPAPGFHPPEKSKVKTKTTISQPAQNKTKAQLAYL